MAETGFLQQKPRSPTSLVIVIAAHAAVLAALAMSKMETVPEIFVPTKLKHIPMEQPPPENPPEPKEKVREAPRSQVDHVRPLVPNPPKDDGVVLQPRPAIPIFDPGPIGTSDFPAGPPKPLPKADPVRVAALMDPRSELQPPYPASEQREGSEGTVVVRLTIGADGRVKAVEKVSAASDSFWRATERHALRHWRFRPATLDGRPIESRKTVTVHFRMDA